MSEIIELTDSDFEEKVKNKVVLLDFFATWCGPCRMLYPILEQIATHYEEKVLVAKVDIDKQQKVSNLFQITSVPTLILLKNSTEIDRILGLRDVDDLKSFIDKHI